MENATDKSRVRPKQQLSPVVRVECNKVNVMRVQPHCYRVLTGKPSGEVNRKSSEALLPLCSKKWSDAFVSREVTLNVGAGSP